MKNQILILLVVMLISCVPEPRMYSRQYSIKNESNVMVKLKFFKVSDNQLVYEIILNDNDIFNGDEVEFSKPHSNDPDYIGPFTAYPSGFLIIIYNQEKQKTIRWNNNGILFSEPISRNVFRHGNYENIGNDNFQFTITEEDYNNAIDCNGNCD